MRRTATQPTRVYRRAVLLVVFAICALGSRTATASGKKDSEMHVVLLGTGYPRPDVDRAGPSTAVVLGNKLFVVDSGRGVMMRMTASHLPGENLKAVFLTHLHSDHISGLPDLFTTTWIINRRAAPLELYGPQGTKEMAAALLRFFKADIHIRRDLVEMLSPPGAQINAHEVQEGVVYNDGVMKVTAFHVDHQPVEPAFGYRFEAFGKIIVISGDTGPSANLVANSRGADILVHEACLPEFFDAHETPRVAARLKHYHSTPEQSGADAQQAGVKLLVFTHLVPGNVPEGHDNAFLQRARKTFRGKIIVGRDLMKF